ncbi:hypothetical protein [Ilumatobacter sp.]
MDTLTILVIVLVVIVALVLAFALIRKKQRTGTVVASPARTRGRRSGR